jgi:hypothetical protein
MGKSKTHMRHGKEARHVRLYHWIINSPAYLSLTPAARAIHLELCRLYNGGNNGQIALSVRVAAERCRISKNTANRSFRELVERGFITLMRPGAFSLKVRHASLWRLNHLNCDVTGELASKEFMRWGLKKQNTVPIRTGAVPIEGQRKTENVAKAA